MIGLKKTVKTLHSLLSSMRKEKIHRILFLFLLIVTICGIAIYFFEKNNPASSIKSITHGIWWGFVTITTVGYGDYFPVTAPGKIIGIALMGSGMVITIILSGTIASILVDRKMKEGKGLQELNLKNHILLCGWNDKSHKVLEGFQKLSRTSREKLKIVLVNEQDSDTLNELQFTFSSKTLDIELVKGKYTQELILKKAGVENAKSAVILADNSGDNSIDNADERTIICVYALTNLNPGLNISVELINEQNEQYLKNTNVQSSIITGEFNSFLLINSAMTHGVPQAAKELMSYSPGNRLSTHPIPANYIGKSFDKLSEFFKVKKEGILIGVIEQTQKLSIEDFMTEDPSAIDEFIKKKFAESEKDFFADTGGKSNVLLNPGWDYIIKQNDQALIIGEVNIV